MSNDTTCEGYTNYETFSWALYPNSDRDSFDWVRMLARKAIASAPLDENTITGIWTAEKTARFRLADQLQDIGEELMPELDSPWSELLRAAFQEINWREIAVNLIEEVESE